MNSKGTSGPGTYLRGGMGLLHVIETLILNSYSPVR